MLEDFSMPAMVCVLEDGQPVSVEGVGHSRTALLGDGVVHWLCALLPQDATEAQIVIARAAERIMRHEAEATTPRFEPREVRCFLPDEVRWTKLWIGIEREDTGRELRFAVVLRLGDEAERLVSGFDANNAQRFAKQLIQKATRARKAKPL